MEEIHSISNHIRTFFKCIIGRWLLPVKVVKVFCFLYYFLSKKSVAKRAKSAVFVLSVFDTTHIAFGVHRYPAQYTMNLRLWTLDYVEVNRWRIPLILRSKHDLRTLSPFLRTSSPWYRTKTKTIQLNLYQQNKWTKKRLQIFKNNT